MTADRGEVAAQAMALVLRCRTGALATIGGDGGPFSSLVAVAPDADGAPILLLSSLAVHTANLKRDPRASLLVAGEPPAGGDPLTVSRLSLVGTVNRAADAGAARARYLTVHPEADGYSRFGDFTFYRMTIRSGHFVAGFGRIVDLSAEELRTAP